MSREVRFYGVAAKNAADDSPEVFLPLTNWPDTDTEFYEAKTNGSVDAVRARSYLERVSTKADRIDAICLAPETDWDMVRVRFDDEKDQLLVPGQVLRPKRGFANKLILTAPVSPPMLRTISARGLDLAEASSIIDSANPKRVILVEIASLDNKLHNVSGFDVHQWQWQGAWVYQGVIADGAIFSDGGDDIAADGQAGGLTFPPAGYGVSSSAAIPPAHNFNLADYIASGAIKMDDGTDYSGPGPYVMDSGNSRFDSNGNPVDNNSQTLYRSAFENAFSRVWAGRLAIELWRGDCPPVGYAPKLAPFRHVHMKALDIASTEDAAATEPHDVILCVPAINIERAQYTFEVDEDSDSSILVALGSPLQGKHTLSMRQLDGDPIPCVKQEPITVDAGSAGAAFLDGNTHPFLNVYAGAINAGAGNQGVISQGSILTLARRFCG